MHVWHNGNGNPSEWIDFLPGEGFFLETEQQRKTEWMSAVEKIPKKRTMSSSRSISGNHDSVNEVDQNAQNMQMTVSVISSGL